MEYSSTKETILNYFEGIKMGGWESITADDMFFTPFGNPKQDQGKGPYVVVTKRFLQVAKSVEVMQIIIEGGNACAIARYRLQSPKGTVSSCNGVEIFSVREGKIRSSNIFFDTAAFSAFLAS